MSQDNANPVGMGGFDRPTADFESIYQRKQVMPGVRFDTAPWDIGQAQPCVTTLEQAGRFQGEVLDIGCGLGENAIYLAGLGYRVTGLDTAHTAIEQAEQRAAQRGLQVEFAVADALSLTGYEARFDSVLDSACYHCFDEEIRYTYTEALHRATTPGALLNLICFPDTVAGTPMPIGVTEQNLCTTLAATGWQITDLDRDTYLTTTGLKDMMAAIGLNLTLAPDEQGRYCVSVWAVQAHHV